MGACRFEHLAHHWGNPETVAEEVRRATHGDMVLWARQQQARVVPETVQLSGIRSQNVTPEYDDSPTEAMEPVRLVAEKDPLPWVQPSIEELKDFQNLWDDDTGPGVAARVAGALTAPFRAVHRASGVQDGNK